MSQVASECPGALAGYPIATGVGVGNLETRGQSNSFQLAGPPAAALAALVVASRVPGLAKRQIIPDVILQSSGLGPFEYFSES